MLGRYQRQFATYIGHRNKASFKKYYQRLLDNLPVRPVDLDVVSFSGSKYLPDQVYSLGSFMTNVGVPVQWTIFSDGTYTPEEIALLQRFPNVSVVPFVVDASMEAFAAACERYPTLKKMLIFEQVQPVRTTILTDSDILFYPAFRSQVDLLKKGNWYIVDESSQFFDEAYIKHQPAIAHPLNLGFLVLNSRPDWSVAFDYLAKKIKDNSIHYWSDQTATHIMATTLPGFEPLDKNLFVTNGSDSFTISHHFDYKRIAVRHFIGPIRHKMWQYPWKKILSATN